MEDATITIQHETFSLIDLTGMDADAQKEIMKSWFLENYEDPAERTPYESREGGYIYIWGGPYDALDELSLFSGYVDDEVIEELADELSADCPLWTSAPKDSDYDDEYINLILSDNEYFQSFMDTMNHIVSITDAKIDEKPKSHLLGILYVSVITAIETYLSDAFINTVVGNYNFTKQLTQTNPEFRLRKFNLSEIFSVYENIDDEIKKYLLSLMWHNLKKIQPLYKSTLGIEFPNDEVMSFLFKAIAKRHDIVHRNGKNTDGEIIETSEQELFELVDKASKFANHINEQIRLLNNENTDF